MKRLTTALTVFILLALCAAPAYAAGYTIDELRMELDIPDEWGVLTQSSSPDDEIFQSFELEPEEFFKYYRDNNIHLNAFSPDLTSEIVLVGV